MTRRLTRPLPTAAILAALAAPAALAVEPVEGARLGTRPGEIAAALGESGYAMTRFEREGGRIALTAIKEGRRVEIRVDPATGKVSRAASRSRGGPWPLPGIGDDAIRARLEADGYRVVTYERERGRVEVCADREGRRWELEIDPHDGRILEAEPEDDR